MYCYFSYLLIDKGCHLGSNPTCARFDARAGMGAMATSDRPNRRRRQNCSGADRTENENETATPMVHGWTPEATRMVKDGTANVT